MQFERQAILDSLYDIVMGTTDDQTERQQIKQSEENLHMLLPREHWRLLLNIHDNFDMLIHKRGMEGFRAGMWLGLGLFMELYPELLKQMNLDRI